MSPRFSECLQKIQNEKLLRRFSICGNIKKLCSAKSDKCSECSNTSTSNMTKSNSIRSDVTARWVWRFRRRKLFPKRYTYSQTRTVTLTWQTPPSLREGATWHHLIIV